MLVEKLLALPGSAKKLTWFLQGRVTARHSGISQEWSSSVVDQNNVTRLAQCYV